VIDNQDPAAPKLIISRLDHWRSRPGLPTTGARWCEAAPPAGSVYRFLAGERGRLFPPELFADLFEPIGRRSVPPSILAVMMVLQRLEGLSDREAADRFAFDTRWRYAAGVADAVAGRKPPASPTRCWWTCGPDCCAPAHHPWPRRCARGFRPPANQGRPHPSGIT
jgi:hypothetical protein